MESVEVAVSDLDGRFEGPWRPGGITFVVSAEGRISEHRSVPFAPSESVLDLGNLTLSRGAVVEGTVMDGAGRPVPEAGIVTRKAGSDVRIPWVRWDPALAARRTDATGRFRLDDCAEGEHVVLAWTRRGVAQSEVLDLRVDRPSLVRLVLLDDPLATTTRGTVVSASGEPVEGLRVGGGAADTFTEASGAFALTLVTPDQFTLRVEDPLERFAPLERQGVVPGAEELKLIVTPAAWIELNLVDVQDTPIGWGHLTVHEAGRSSSRIDLDASGRVRVLRPESSFTVEASAPGFRAATLGPFEPDSIDGPLAIVLEPGSFLRGRVQHEGRPVVGAVLHLQAAGQLDCRESVRSTPADRPFATYRSNPLGQSDGTTDSGGHFVVEVRGSGLRTLRVSAEGLGYAWFGPWNFGEDGVLDDLELEFPVPGAIEGRVVLALGASPEGRFVGASNGNGLARTAPVEPDGRYRLDELAPGEYQVRPCLPPVSRWEVVRRSQVPCLEPIAWDCRVLPGQSTHFDLDLSDEGQCRVVGRLLIDGVASAGGEARLLRGDAVLAASKLADGEFGLAVRVPGPYWLYLVDGTREFALPLELVPGETRRDLSVVFCGRLRFIWQVRPQGMVTVSADAGAGWRFGATLFPEGDQTFLDVPEGTVQVAFGCYDRGEFEYSDPVAIEMRAGEEVVVPWVE